MKRIVALLAAMLLALSATAAAADTFDGVRMDLTVGVDRSFVTAYAAQEDSTGALGQVVNAMMNLLDKAVLSLTIGEDSLKLALRLNDTVLADISAAPDGQNYVITSSLAPSYALKVDQTLVLSIVEQFMAQSEITLNGEAVSDAYLEALIQGFEALGEDIGAYGEKIAAQMEVSPDGKSASGAVTTWNVADLLEIVAQRLSAEAALQTFLQSVLEQEGETMPVSEVISNLQELAGELRAQSEQAVILENLLYNEDGSSTVEMVDVDNTFLLSIDAFEDSERMAYDVLTIVCENGAQDWQSVYDGLFDGSNKEDTALSVRFSADATGVANVELKTISAGESVSIYADAVTLDAGTANEKVQWTLSIDPGMGMRMAWLTLTMSNASAPTPPDTTGCTALDVLTMSEEDANALAADLQMNGLPALLSAAQAEMPEEVSLLLSLLMSSTAQ